MQENYLAKWLNNELTTKELETFEKSDEYASYKKIIKTTQGLGSPDFDMDKALAASELKQTSKTVKVIKLNPVKKLMWLAAPIALLLAGSYFYFSTQNETITTAIADNVTFLLPDSSEVRLNSDSKISYSKKNWDKKRDLKLQGEAYFKVAEGEKFTVKTASGLITVLGTQFNVKSTENFFEVTCFEGLVSVTFEEETVKLPDGFSFLVLDNKFTVLDLSDVLEPSWIHNESTFRNIPLRFVLNEFERQYKVTVDAKNIDAEKLFTGSFNHKNMDTALKSICNPNQLKFKLDGDKVFLYAENAT